MKQILFSLVLAVASLPALACDLYFKSEDLCLNVTWEVLPPARANGTMLLTFTDAKDAGRVVTPKYTPNVILWMTSMGHGSKPVTLNFIEEGKFRSTNVFFVMGGPWDIKFQLKDGSTVVEEVVQKIKI